MEIQFTDALFDLDELEGSWSMVPPRLVCPQKVEIDVIGINSSIHPETPGVNLI